MDNLPPTCVSIDDDGGTAANVPATQTSETLSQEDSPGFIAPPPPTNPSTLPRLTSTNTPLIKAYSMQLLSPRISMPPSPMVIHMLPMNTCHSPQHPQSSILLHHYNPKHLIEPPPSYAMPSSPSFGVYHPCVDEEDGLEVPKGPSKAAYKRRRAKYDDVVEVSKAATKSLPMRRRKTKKLKEEDEDDTRQLFRGPGWKDAHVVSLIHLRGSMNNEFMGPQKQGVDLWNRLRVKLAALHPDFDKGSESCRKKWGKVFTAYKEDKAHNSENDRSEKCKWFNIVDQYMHDRAQEVCHAHASAMEEPQSAPSIPLDEEKETNPPISCNKGNKRYGREAFASQAMENTLQQIAEQGKELLASINKFEEKKISILESLNATIASLADHLKNK